MRKKIPFTKKVRVLCFCIRSGYDEQLAAQRYHVPLHLVQEWLVKFEDGDVEAFLGPQESISKKELDRAALDLSDAIIDLGERLERIQHDLI